MIFKYGLIHVKNNFKNFFQQTATNHKHQLACFTCAKNVSSTISVVVCFRHGLQCLPWELAILLNFLTMFNVHKAYTNILRSKFLNFEFQF